MYKFETLYVIILRTLQKSKNFIIVSVVEQGSAHPTDSLTLF